MTYMRWIPKITNDIDVEITFHAPKSSFFTFCIDKQRGKGCGPEKCFCIYDIEPNKDLMRALPQANWEEYYLPPTIDLVKYRGDNDRSSGKRFCKEVLLPLMKTELSVYVVLTGKGRWNRSFLDEAIAGLIRYYGFTKEELNKKLFCNHEKLISYNWLIDNLVSTAEIERIMKKVEQQ